MRGGLIEQLASPDQLIDKPATPEVADFLRLGGIADLVMGEEAGFGLIPAIGDFIDIPRSRMGERENYRGRVCRRLFRYVLGYCYVRIVIEEVEAAAWSECR